MMKLSDIFTGTTMTMAIQIIQSGVLAFFSTLFFSYIFNAPKRSVFWTGLNSAIGWMIFYAFQQAYGAEVLGSFLGAMAVALLSEILARRFKMPATIFLISGIIPLVPGANLYYTMLALVQNQNIEALTIGTKTIFMSGSIAVAIAISSSIFKIQSKNKN